ncbi:hypothetical protein SAMD00019534_024290 [Acytostelium subglobosum LB1]|uniref:hypothetical protein n=1 Tax=Acytostelium subglobosum LB1 TaxID=1410327 RepID=UPI000644B16A|nr:hypothetical protein SAMD00019534_024290 [Acytostelium subglobosum LB1]GAM19254.1 hypothetical protein SAMD00019534_024290 [Acytostelium subglobosum LB1]|eukprot:XP_012757181.1 hypothetical protein SAMD00019534_024290 [Acytostelium subglobosum LB1]
MNNNNIVIGITKKSNRQLCCRAAEIKDVDALVDLINFAYRGTGREDNDKSVQSKGWTNESHYISGKRLTHDSLKPRVEQQNPARALTFVVEFADGNDAERKPIASIGVVRDDDVNAHLEALSVEPMYQSEGIGGILMAYAEEYIVKQWGCRVISMCAVSIRNELLSWYYRLGYKPTGVYVPFHNDDHESRPFVQDIKFEQLSKSFN